MDESERMTGRIVQLTSLPALTAAGAMVALSPLAEPAAASTFDGRWSVAIVAESGDCSARYTVPIEVAGGKIRYAGRFNAEASGNVGSSGQLDVSFSYREDLVRAQGSLAGRNGFGSWTSPTQECGGTWRAVRRA
jgi:hypothetical protein